MSSNAPILITAGGTGGHVYPGLAVAQALIQQGIPVVWMGTRKGLEAKIVPEAGIEIAWLEVTGVRGKGFMAKLLAPFRILKAMRQSMKIMRKYRPSAVLGLGGFVSGPGGIVAALMGIPVIIHEQNAYPGTTNKILSRFVLETLEGFDNTFPEKIDAVPVGNPVRPEITRIAPPAERLASHDGAFRLLVVGGSLGAQALNELVPVALTQLPKESVQVVHQAGEKTLLVATKAYDDAGIQAHVVPFIEDMAGAYEWADLIICRSGALTVAEVAAAGLASILVPYPYAIDDHQTANAMYLAKEGAAILSSQKDLTAESLAQVLKVLMDQPAQLLAMSEKARSLAKPDATHKVAAVCADIAGYPYELNSFVAPVETAIEPVAGENDIAVTITEDEVMNIANRGKL
ncbi:MAG: undecaprenyldiphospho-muramoylpentapeptide beta-N-acetylglucosaminyltransferase [Thiotrichaceae bacterium]|nr:undecaprenyldiphospho-muramoylpentapeptide beta-N-acetylglucosaminyltransferase [Thiotrichaceae bacterium]